MRRRAGRGVVRDELLFVRELCEGDYAVSDARVSGDRSFYIT